MILIISWSNINVLPWPEITKSLIDWLEISLGTSKKKKGIRTKKMVWNKVETIKIKRDF